jgi:glycosyltransferase involved in cell wall biosynthesis
MSNLISICIPNLNNGAFLRARFDSILNQTYTNLELIFVDSASTDDSWAIASSYAKKDSRIKLIQHPPRGLYLNWNIALSYAKGEFIHIATADDTCEPTFLEKALKPLLTYKEMDLVQVNLNYINNLGYTLPNKFPNSFYFAPLKNYLYLKHMRYAPFDGLFAVSGTIPCSSISQQLFRSTSLRNVGPFSTLFGNSGDFEFQTRVGLNLNKFIIPEALVTWRIHDNQATKITRHPQKFLDRASMLQYAFNSASKEIPEHLWLPLKTRIFINSLLTGRLTYIHNKLPGKIDFLSLYNPKQYLTYLLNTNYAPYLHLIKYPISNAAS